MITYLFDFSNKTWFAVLTKRAQHNFEEELTIDKLLDLGLCKVLGLKL
jgi:hypothetical protein